MALSAAMQSMVPKGWFNSVTTRYIFSRKLPTLAAFLTIAVGATLIAVMLPLIGIMGSIA